MPNTLSVKTFFQSKHLLVQPEGVSPFPVSCCLGEETDSNLTTPCSQAAVE